MKRVLGFIVLAVVWEAGSRHTASPMFPPLTVVLPSFAGMFISGEIFVHMGASLLNVTLGFVLASFVGFILGIIIFQSDTARTILMPVVDAMRPVAALTIFPLLILVLGLGISSKVAVIFWTAWPAVVLNTMRGLEDVDRSVCEAAEIDGADALDLLTKIRIPLAFPVILTGLRIGLSGGWISLVSSEMLGANRGLGYLILAYSQTFQFPKMYATIITIALVGLIMNVALARMQNGEGKTFLSFGERAAGQPKETFVYGTTR